jgi:hypothetical protein
VNLEQFFIEFRNEHREIRDLILDMITAFLKKDLQAASKLLGKLNVLAGPHFRFEEEALYPSLIPILGEQYINKLYTDHDLAIARAGKLVKLLGKENFLEEEFIEGINLLRALLPHVSDCEGLTIMVEKLDKSKIDHIIETMEEARSKNVNLLNWANSDRNRKLLSIN